jgi:hypothetical protein
MALGVVQEHASTAFRAASTRLCWFIFGLEDAHTHIGTVEFHMPPRPLWGLKKSLQELRKLLHVLRKRKRRHDATRAWMPTRHVRRSAVLIFRLLNETMWSVIFVRKWQALNFGRSLALPCGVTDATVRAWNLELHDDKELSAMMKNLAHPERVRVDRFFMESIVFEYIGTQSKKELTVPTTMVMD